MHSCHQKHICDYNRKYTIYIYIPCVDVYIHTLMINGD